MRQRPSHHEADAHLARRGIARTEDHTERKRDALQAAAFRLQQNLAALKEALDTIAVEPDMTDEPDAPALNVREGRPS